MRDRTISFKDVVSSVSDAKIQEMIKQRAYDICAKRGCAPGNDWKDWFEAEKQVKRELHLK